MKKKFVDYFMSIAEVTAQLSNAVRLKVGSVIVRDNKILATGYNGTPTGWDNDCEDKVWDKGAGGWLSPEEFDEQYPFEGWHEGAQCDVRYGLKTKDIVLHSEANALTKIARSTESSEGATLFCTHAPCLQCAKLIYQSGITKLYYREQYRDTSGLDFLRQGNVDIEKYQSNQNRN